MVTCVCVDIVVFTYIDINFPYLMFLPQNEGSIPARCTLFYKTFEDLQKWLLISLLVNKEEVYTKTSSS